jgi:hypothetical protein
MPTPAPANQIAFRYRSTDSQTGVSRETAKRLAAYLGVDETQAIHHALRQMALRVLPQYVDDDGALTAQQMRQIKKHAGVVKIQTVRSSLIKPIKLTKPKKLA